MADQLDREESKPAPQGGTPADTPEPPPRSGAPRRRRIQGRLISLVLACVVPICLIAGLLVYYSYQQKRVLLEQRALETARVLSMVVDQELAAMQASATALATSPAAISGDVPAFDKQAHVVLQDYPTGTVFTLNDAGGQQVANTFFPLGTPLPKLVAWDQTKKVFETGKPVIINLYSGALTKRLIVGVVVPVIREGQVKYAAMMTVPANHFEAVLSQQSIPPGWFASILDRKLVVVARDQREQGYVGIPAVPPLFKAASEAAEGRIESKTREGIDIIAVFHRSAVTGWTVSTGIPKAVMLAGIRQWLGWTIGGALLFSMIGLALALFLARRITGSIRSLTGPALALGSGEPVNIGPLDLAEADEVGQSLVKASQLLEQRAEERDKAERHLAHVASFPELNPNPIFETDLEGKVTYANPAAQDLFPDLLEHGANHPLLAELASVIAEFTTGPKQVIVRDVEADGRVFLQTNNYLSQLGRVRVYFTDVTERKRAEQALRESEQRLRLFIEHAPVALAMFDRNMRYLYVSRRWLNDYNLGGRELRGLSHYDVFPEIGEAWKETHRRGLAGEVLTAEGDRFERADGSVQWVRWEIRPWHVAAGEVGGIVIFTEDITERKRAEQALREQADLLRLSFDAIIVWRFGGAIESWNVGAERLYGFSESEALGRVTHELLWTVQPVPWTEIEAELREKRYWEGELHHFTKEGREVVVSARMQLIVGSDGVERILETNRDITERKRAQEELQLAKRHAEDAAVQLRTIVENMAERLYVCDSKGHLILMNEAFRRTYPGTDAPEYPRTFAEQWEAFDMAGNPVPVADWPIGLALRGQKVRGAEFRIRSKITGKDMISSYNASPVFDSQGKVMMALFTSQDIAERKRAEAQLRRLNRTLTALNNSDQALLHAVDEEALLPQVCAIVTEDCGYAMVWIGFAESDANKTVRPVVKAGFEEGYLDSANITWGKNEFGSGPTGAAIRTGQPQSCRNMLTDPKFEPWREKALKRGYASSLVLPLILPSEHTAAAAAGGPDLPCGKVFGAITIYSREVDPFSEDEVKLLSELAADLAYGIGAMRLRKAHALAEAALRASEERWATTLRSIGDAVISTCAQGKVIFMNDVAQKLTGWSLSEAKDRPLDEVFNIVNEVTRIKPESPVAKVARTGLVVGLANHTALIRRDGTEIPVEDSGAPIRDNEGNVTGVVLVFHDVSEQRKMQQAVRNSDRLATAGRLAATLAHEIHNPLDSVGGLLYLVQQSTKEAETRRFASMASEELARVTQMTQQMLTFQRESTKPLPVQVKEILDSVLALYQRKIESAAIQIEQEVDVLPAMLAQPGELRQVFANLLGNAIEAVGRDHGKIRLRAYMSRDGRGGRSGIRVVFADNGCGIPAEAREKIFDPFFTTKGESGTGLGLWITSDIVRKYDGRMRLRSTTRPGRSGTCFSVFFPLPASAD